jgi:hypothetical protein
VLLSSAMLALTAQRQERNLLGNLKGKREKKKKKKTSGIPNSKTLY